MIAFAEHDSPEFRQQSIDLQTVLKRSGARVALVDVQGEWRCRVEVLLTPAGVDHFDVIERLSEAGFALTQALVAAIVV